ncbi:MAG TPA: hypothetical protein VH682_12300 [Gemmataceae bacterium]|jgi:hypothetical protein
MSHDRNNPDRREGADDSARESTPAFDDDALPPDFEADEVVAGLDRLRALCRSVPPPEPEDTAWTAALTRIHEAVRISPARLAGPTVEAASQAAPRRRWAILGLAAAAALIAVLLARPLWRKTPSPQPRSEEPFPVAEAGDVDIIRIDARDVAGLVVGEPPVSGELIFARHEDVRVVECKCCPMSGNVAKLSQGEVPMLVTSITRVDPPDDE